MVGHIDINVLALYSLRRRLSFVGDKIFKQVIITQAETHREYKSWELINGRDHLLYLQFKNNLTKYWASDVYWVLDRAWGWGASRYPILKKLLVWSKCTQIAYFNVIGTGCYRHKEKETESKIGLWARLLGKATVWVENSRRLGHVYLSS